MDNCIFCQMVNGKIPVEKLYEDDKVLAFPDINPMAPVHILIIPKQHIDSILAIDNTNSDILASVVAAIKYLTSANELFRGGFRVVTNCGENAGQSVPHLHFHLLGGRRFAWPPG